SRSTQTRANFFLLPTLTRRFFGESGLRWRCRRGLHGFCEDGVVDLRIPLDARQLDLRNLTATRALASVCDLDAFDVLVVGVFLDLFVRVGEHGTAHELGLLVD